MTIKTRFVFMIEIDRDDVPGWNHDPDDFRVFMEKFLEGAEHYRPEVKFIGMRPEIILEEGPDEVMS